MHVSAPCLDISNISSIFSACFNSIDRNTSYDGKGKTLCFLLSKICACDAIMCTRTHNI
jgi:hypothetical protein